MLCEQHITFIIHYFYILHIFWAIALSYPWFNSKVYVHTHTYTCICVYVHIHTYTCICVDSSDSGSDIDIDNHYTIHHTFVLFIHTSWEIPKHVNSLTHIDRYTQSEWQCEYLSHVRECVYMCVGEPLLLPACSLDFAMVLQQIAICSWCNMWCPLGPK